MTTDNEDVTQTPEGADEDSPGVRQEQQDGEATLDPKIAAEMAQPAADRAESESREGRTEPR